MIYLCGSSVESLNPVHENHMNRHGPQHWRGVDVALTPRMKMWRTPARVAQLALRRCVKWLKVLREDLESIRVLYPLVMTNSLLLTMAIEIVSFPLQMVDLSIVMLVYQRVSQVIFSGDWTWLPGKSLTNGSVHRNITYKWSIVHCHVWLPEDIYFFNLFYIIYTQ